MCGRSAPKTATVDPEAERRQAEAEATAKANESILAGARRKRGQQGLLSADAAEESSSVLASASVKK